MSKEAEKPIKSRYKNTKRIWCRFQYSQMTCIVRSDVYDDDPELSRKNYGWGIFFSNTCMKHFRGHVLTDSSKLSTKIT